MYQIIKTGPIMYISRLKLIKLLWFMLAKYNSFYNLVFLIDLTNYYSSYSHKSPV